MNRWIVILIVIAIILGLSTMVVRSICQSIETSVVYKNPIVTYKRTIRENRTVVLSGKTDIHFGKADKIELLNNGSYAVFNPVDVSFTSTTSSTTVAKSETVENGTSKPDLSLLKNKPIILGINIGYNAVFNPNILATNIPTFNIENWTIGLFTEITEPRISINYTHLHSNADSLTIGIGVKIF